MSERFVWHFKSLYTQICILYFKFIFKVKSNVKYILPKINFLNRMYEIVFTIGEIVQQFSK